MWKFLSRGVREAVERNLNVGGRSEVRVQKNGKLEKSNVNYCQRLAPVVCDKWKHYCSSGSSNSEHGSQKKKEGSSTQGFSHTWFGAFSWSGVLAVGWMLSQPCLLRKWNRLNDCANEKRIRILDLIPLTAWTQPITPGVTAVNLCNDLSDGPTYGPKTAEEALDEAADEFRAVHNSILAEIENKRGVDLIKRKKNREALELFISASHRGYGPAAYNLAQCYELGVGIKQNFHEAARWYQKAVDRGHLTAMYNLGVFYVHGWGGLTPDTEKARKLFKEAARKGQPDAKAALGIQDPGAVPEIPVDSGELSKQDAWNSSSDDFSSGLTNVSNNAEEIFKLASSFESSVDSDPVTSQLMLELYKIASDMGHAEANNRAKVLQALHVGSSPDTLSMENRKPAELSLSNLALSNF